MDVTYDIQQIGSNKVLFNETVSVVDPFFLCVLTDPWNQEQKTATIIPDGTDGEWIIDFIGIAQAYESLISGQIFFRSVGTWECDIYLNEVIASALIRNVKLQVN